MSQDEFDTLEADILARLARSASAGRAAAGGHLAEGLQDHRHRSHVRRRRAPLIAGRPQSHVQFVGGKGGVGKTTCAAAIALRAARAGQAHAARLDRSRAVARRCARAAADAVGAAARPRCGATCCTRSKSTPPRALERWLARAPRGARGHRAARHLARRGRRRAPAAAVAAGHRRDRRPARDRASSPTPGRTTHRRRHRAHRHTLRMLAMPAALGAAGGRVRPDAGQAPRDGRGAPRPLAAGRRRRAASVAWTRTPVVLEPCFVTRRRVTWRGSRCPSAWPPRRRRRPSRAEESEHHGRSASSSTGSRRRRERRAAGATGGEGSKGRRFSRSSGGSTRGCASRPCRRVDREPRGIAALRALGRHLRKPGVRPGPRAGRVAPFTASLSPDAQAVDVSAIVPRGTQLVLFGGKGGVGKTTCAAAAAIGLALSSPDLRVLLLSADPGALDRRRARRRRLR